MYPGKAIYRIPYADTDQMGVVYYGNYLRYFEMGRSEWLVQTGYPYSRIEEKGIGLPIIEAHIDYKAPAKYEDLIRVDTKFEQLSKVRVKVSCQVYNQNDELLVEGYTIHSCFHLEKKRPIKLPICFIEHMQKNLD